jgi:serine carboxypeptidase-like clade II
LCFTIHLCHASGNTDAVIPVTSTRYTINALKLPTVSPWRAWYDDGEVTSTRYTINALKLLTLIKAFLAGTSMPTLEPLTAAS